MKKKVTSKHSFLTLRNILLAPFVLYLAIYMFSLSVAVLHGGTPLIYSAVTNSFKDTALRLYGLRNAGILYNVATKEVEDCDTNPMEYYPEGHTDEVREYGRGQLYAYDLYQVKNFGFPQRFVENGINCLENSQSLTKEEIIGTFRLESMSVDFGVQPYTTETGEVKYLNTSTHKTYANDQVNIAFTEDNTFTFAFKCITVSADYVFSGDTLTLENTTTQLLCQENDISEQELVVLENFPTYFSISLNPTEIHLFSQDNKFYLSLSR